MYWFVVSPSAGGSCLAGGRKISTYSRQLPGLLDFQTTNPANQEGAVNVKHVCGDNVAFPSLYKLNVLLKILCQMPSRKTLHTDIHSKLYTTTNGGPVFSLAES